MNAFNKGVVLFKPHVFTMVLAGVAWGSPVLAQEGELSEVQVRASLLGEREIPTEVLQRTQARDMKDVFATEPSVTVGGGARNAQRIYLRGIEASNLHVSIDGARQGSNLHQHRGGIGGIDPDLLKRVEVDPGPGADRGPGALGGAIRLETVDAQDLLDPGRQAGATLKLGYGSADRSWRGASTVYGLLGDKLGLLAHVSGENSKDYRVGGGAEVPNSAGRDRDYFLKMTLLNQGGHTLRLSAEQNSNQGLYLWGSTGSDMGYAPEGSVPVYQETERRTWTLSHAWRASGQEWLDWKFNLYGNDNTLRNVDAGTEVTGKEVGGSLGNTFTFQWGGIGHRLSLGGDWFSEDLESADYKGVGRSNTSRNLGLYLQERMQIGPVLLSLGARYDDYKAEYGPRTVSGNEISPNGGIEVDLGRGVSTFARYGEAVRGSGIIPASWMSNITSSTNFNDGKAFEPERSRQREVGARYQAQGLFVADDQFQAELTFFNLHLQNTIERVGGGGGAVSKIWSNPDTLISRGWEIRSGWGRGNYHTTLGFSRVDSENQDGDPVAITRRKNAPTGDRLVWDNRWQLADGLTLGYTLTAVGRLKDVPQGQLERPGYVLHDLQSEWRPGNFKGLSLALAIRNLGDKRYCDQTSIASGDSILHEPGRDLRLSLSYRF